MLTRLKNWVKKVTRVNYTSSKNNFDIGKSSAVTCIVNTLNTVSCVIINNKKEKQEK